MINLEACRARFLSKVEQRGPDDCWPYAGSLRFYLKKSHAIEFRRVAWMLEHGLPSEPGRRMFSICRNDHCANPKHVRYETISDRFWNRVDVAGPNDCWLWTGSHQKGYGRLRAADGVRRLAHRFSWEFHNGPIPSSDEEICVLHRCDVPPCVNPKHLFLGTDKDNTADKVGKGRHLIKLTPAAIELIRGRRANGERANTLADEFGVAPSTVYALTSGHRRAS